MADTPPLTDRAGPGTTQRLREDVRGAAVAYAGHLLAGGVTTWAEFLAGAAPGTGAGPGRPPGAAQAELLRRLTLHAGPSAPLPPSLAEHVLGRAAPGRGRVDVLLTDPPERVPVAELLRVGAGVLADLVAALPDAVPARPGGPVAGHRVPTRGVPSYRLEGPPLTLADLRARLAAAGVPPGRPGRRLLRRQGPDVVVVVALPLRRALVEVWSRRAQRGAARSWRGTVAEWHAAHRLPQGVAYDRLAASWATRIGAGRVHVVTGADLDGQVAAVLGHRPAAPARRPAVLPARLPPTYVEVVRRTSEVLTFRVPPEDKQRRLDLLVRVLADVDEQEPTRLDLPPRQQEWLARVGRRTASRLRTGGYVLHGPLALGRALGRDGGHRRRPGHADRAVLTAMLEAVLRVHRAAADGERGTTL